MSVTAIILCAGKGSRMKSDIDKQYMLINNKEIIVYAIEAFENSTCVDEIILVVSSDRIDYVKEEILNKYNFNKIIKIVPGGKERQDSVYSGLKSMTSNEGIVLIHDGARPMIKEEHIKKLVEETKKSGACILGVKSKDTIKITDDNGNIHTTPDRNRIYLAQTPQAFNKELIIGVYEKGYLEEKNFTDDSMLVETYSDIKVKIVEGSYENIKITTQEDLFFAKRYLN